MSKGLESLNRIKKVNYYEDDDEIIEDCYGIDKDLCIIEKELKALEIIKVKKVEMRILFSTFNYENGYNAYNLIYEITREEYDLLKEALL